MGAYAFLHVPLLILAVFSFNASQFHGVAGILAALVRGVASGSRSDRIGGQQPDHRGSFHGAGHGSAERLRLMGCGNERRAGSQGLCILSLVTPEIVTGVSLLAFFQWVFRFLNLRLGMHTVILAHVGFSLAYVVVVVMARLRSFDPALEEAALDLGATEFTAFRAVTVAVS